ncbi:hypothetical protein EVAR_74728_1 [Eumeta japonica]|uniref:Uncharacterized protein n=1 Tax=Eumeta variegata TaxID=151549 RepID=A0A4C1SRS1_EUMVA|nr:hypothetical protein EVAR_74728_1 [Eumeta japonica]
MRDREQPSTGGGAVRRRSVEPPETAPVRRADRRKELVFVLHTDRWTDIGANSISRAIEALASKTDVSDFYQATAGTYPITIGADLTELLTFKCATHDRCH